MRRAPLFFLSVAVVTALWCAAAAAQIGASCSGAQGWSADTNGFNWVCNTTSGSVVYPAYQFGAALSSSCGSGNAGQVQWTGSAFEGCISSSWVTFNTTSAPTVSTYCTTASGLTCTGNSGATWSNSLAYTYVDVYICGGGGSGGGGLLVTAGSGNASGGGGGGGGACVEQIFRASDLSNTVTITLGSGGSGNTGNTNGAVGGTSTFGSYITAYGAGGGAAGALSASNNVGGSGGDLSGPGVTGSSA